MAKDNKTIKVVANYDGYTAESLDLWGVTFKLVDGEYYAELPVELAEEMIKNERAFKV